MRNIEQIKSPLKAIKEKCIDCCCGDRREVKLCPAEDCVLFPFRFGKNPFRTHSMTEEQRAAAVIQLQEARSHKNVD